jgi:alkylhydroperoxidase/carboxymuconolactone decarboxylase family protein YurZ
MNAQDLKAIDPALGLMGEFSKLTKNTAGHIQKMRQEAVFTDGVIPAKIKALAAALWGISARCEPCLKFYILKAKELGASDQEIGEFGDRVRDGRLRRRNVGAESLPGSQRRR